MVLWIGYKYIKSIQKISKGIKEFKKEDVKHYTYNIELIECLPKMVNMFDLPNMERNYLECQTTSKYNNKDMELSLFKEDELQDIYNGLDNNNGYIFIDMNKDFDEIKYMIIGGTEDIANYPELTFMKYWELFEERDKIKEIRKDEEFLELEKTVMDCKRESYDYFNNIYKSISTRLNEEDKKKND